MLTLKDILSPLAPDLFLSEYWGKKWLLQQSQPGRFNQLLSWKDIEDILARQPTQLRVVKSGTLVPEATYTKGRYRDFLELRPGSLMHELRQGATLVIDGIDKLHAPIREAAQAIEWATQEQIQVNLYVSCGTTPGFDLHWDDHDVIILHLHGRKSWKVYGASRLHPHRKDRLPERKFAPPPERIWEGHLQSGDLLYLPRGWWHEVTATAEPTAHLTVSITKRTGLDFMNWLVEDLVESEIFRQDLPRHASAEEKGSHQLRLKEALLQHLSAKSLDDFFEAWGALSSAKPQFSLPWQATDQIIPASTDLIVTRTMTRKPQLRTDANGTTFNFVADGKRMILPIACRPVLELILERECITLADILAAPDLHMDESSLRGLLKSMIQNALVVVREANT